MLVHVCPRGRAYVQVYDAAPNAWRGAEYVARCTAVPEGAGAGTDEEASTGDGIEVGAKEGNDIYGRFFLMTSRICRRRCLILGRHP